MKTLVSVNNLSTAPKYVGYIYSAHISALKNNKKKKLMFF